MTGPRGRLKLFSPERLDQAAREVQALADRQGIHLALIGGFAMQWYGSDRFTKDVDFVADGLPRGLKPVRPVTFGGHIFLTSDGVTVDVIVRRDQEAALYREALDCARKMRGTAYRLVRPEHLVAMKFGARRGRDLDDIAGLLGRRRFSAKRARAVISRHYGWYVAREFDNFIAEIRWRRRAGISEGGRG